MTLMNPASSTTPMRRGFSLLELLVAVAMMGGVLLAFLTFTQKMGRAGGLATQRTTASDLAVERLETVKAATDYAAIDAMATTESNLGTGYSAFTRQTYVRRTQS